MYNSIIDKGVFIMSFLQAFVMCFIAYLIYKVIKPSGIPKPLIEELKLDFLKASTNSFKESMITNKAKVVSHYDDLRSGDPVLVEQAIAQINAVFDEDIVDADKNIAKYTAQLEANKKKDEKN